jgi:hypothetical protein
LIKSIRAHKQRILAVLLTTSHVFHFLHRPVLPSLSSGLTSK